MRVTLTRDLGPHAKGSTREVTPAVARRLIRKGAAKEAKAAKEATEQKSDGKDGGDSDKP